MPTDPKLELPQSTLGAATSDSLSFAFADVTNQLYGSIKVGVSQQIGVAVAQISLAGHQIAENTVTAQLTELPNTFSNLDLAGIDISVEQPHQLATLSLATDQVAMDLVFATQGQPQRLRKSSKLSQITSAEGIDYFCSVQGTVHYGQKRLKIDGIGQRSHQWGKGKPPTLVASQSVNIWQPEAPLQTLIWSEFAESISCRWSSIQLSPNALASEEPFFTSNQQVRKISLELTAGKRFDATVSEVAECFKQQLGSSELVTEFVTFKIAGSSVLGKIETITPTASNH